MTHTPSVESSLAGKVRQVALWLQEKKGKDLAAIDVSRICTVTEAMLVVTAANVRQAQAMADHVLAMCGERKLSFLGMDGFKTGQWILVDLNDVLVHIFQEEVRQFYNIEGLWAEGEDIDLPQWRPDPAGA